MLPSLNGKLHAMAMRVPVPDGSITDLVANLSRDVSLDEVNAAFKAAADVQAQSRAQVITATRLTPTTFQSTLCNGC